MRQFSEFRMRVDDVTRETAEAARLRSLATWAYLLLRPGMEFVRQRSNFILGWQAAAAAGAALGSGVSAGAMGSAGRPPLGSWMILPDLTSPATQTVLPSNDALYGAAHVELDRLGPVVLTVPANIDGRYYSVAVMDAHMNNIAHIGPRWTGSGAGHFVLLPPGWDAELPDGVRPISCSTVSVLLYNRMLVQYVEGDIDRVRTWQSRLRISQLGDWPDTEAVPAAADTSDLVHPDINGMTSARDYLRIGLAHLARNPVVAEGSWLASMVSSAGLVAAAEGSLAAAVDSGVDDATALIDTTLATWPRVNGWMRPDTQLGRPNPQVLRSAAFQQFQIGSNDADESVYYFVDDDAAGRLLDASDGGVYELAFSRDQLPPIHDGGYWSVTMYSADSLLVANPVSHYATRPTRPGTVFGQDGGLAITLAPTLPGRCARRELAAFPCRALPARHPGLLPPGRADQVGLGPTARPSAPVAAWARGFCVSSGNGLRPPLAADQAQLISGRAM